MRSGRDESDAEARVDDVVAVAVAVAVHVVVVVEVAVAVVVEARARAREGQTETTQQLQNVVDARDLDDDDVRGGLNSHLVSMSKKNKQCQKGLARLVSEITAW